jgi:hypothetical protein
MVVTTKVVTLALAAVAGVFSGSALPASASPAPPLLTQVSADPYTDPGVQHAAEVQPSTAS